jgi:hypothetical protein
MQTPSHMERLHAFVMMLGASHSGITPSLITDAWTRTTQHAPGSRQKCMGENHPVRPPLDMLSHESHAFQLSGYYLICWSLCPRLSRALHRCEPPELSHKQAQHNFTTLADETLEGADVQSMHVA